MSRGMSGGMGRGMRLIRQTVCLALGVFLTACAGAAPVVSAPVGALAATPAAATPADTSTAAEPSPPSPALFLTPGLTATVPSGLMYRLPNGLWLGGADGMSQRLSTDPYALISPDGQWALTQCGCAHAGSSYEVANLKTDKVLITLIGATQVVWSADSSLVYYTADSGEGSDLWVYDLATSQKRNLSNTPDRIEALDATRPMPTDPLVFYSFSARDPIFSVGEGWVGYVTLMRADGTGYQVISDVPVTHYAALAPDGQTLAYAGYVDINSQSMQTAWLYHLGVGAQFFPLEQYGFSRADTSLASAAWSPDGKQIAWWTLGWGANGVSGIGVFDLAAKTMRLAGRFRAPDSGGGSTPAPLWSPDGQWLAFYGAEMGRDQYGVWLVEVGGHQRRQVVGLSKNYDTCSKAWSPDSRQLALACNDPALAPGIWLAEVSTGQMLPTNVVTDSAVIDWSELRP